MFWKRRRHLVTFLAFLGFFNIYTLRVTLNVAVVAMTSFYPVALDNGTVVQIQDFNWDSKTRAVVLSSFFWGYVCTQILGGWLGARLGGSRVFGFGIFVTALLTVFSPPLARVNVYLLVATRVVQGFFEGGTYPCLQALWARWAPPQERTLMVGVAFSGVPVGTVLGLQITGLIGSYLGWSAMFYFTGR
ncbi:hypothetical protein J6590_008653 [Homalodisca vitripennis]|nr:hypothetical protein J6590_008653 [Homalodisca vitripennis]